VAEDVIRPAGTVEVVEPPTRTFEPSRAERARHSAYRGRFVAVYFALALVLGCAIGALAVGLRSSSGTTARPQARVFTPSTSGELGAIDLASDVQQTYRLANGKAFVDVVASRNTLQNGNLGLLRVRYQIIQPADALNGRDSQLLRPTDAIQYSLCGNGPQCAIPGKVTAAYGGLLRREGLELALRTFLNDSRVDNVVVFLGPVPVPQGSSLEGYVLMFSRAVITRNNPALLSRPLGETLPRAGSKLTPAQMTPDQILRIDELTQPYLYLFRYQLIGGRDAVLALQPPTGS
jgi:hypothetical protein